MYRSNVCVVILNKKKNKVLMFHRAGVKKGGWQFPQGGVDPGESERQTLYRELKEEIGTYHVKILKVSPKRIKYKFPKWVQKRLKGQEGIKRHYKGQKQRWFLVQLQKGTKSIHFDHEPIEFDDYKWVSPEKVPPKIVSFKRKAYIKGMNALGVL